MNVPGFSIHEELEYVVAAGLTPLQALKSGTSSPARFFGLDDAGDIRPGMMASLVVLAANPLYEISATRGFIGVVRAGRWFSNFWIETGLADIAGHGL